MKYILTAVITLFLSTSKTLAQADSVKVIIMQKQSVSWGNIHRGRANVDSFKKQTQLILPKEYTFKKATIFFAGANFTNVDSIAIYTNELNEIQGLINKCTSGTIVYVDKILVTDQVGKETFLSSAGFPLF